MDSIENLISGHMLMKIVQNFVFSFKIQNKNVVETV